MTTKTTITLSPLKRRCHGSPNLKKRRLSSLLINRKQQMNSSSTPAVNYEKDILSITKLPDLLNDIFIEQQRREMIINIGTILRKVGDQMDEQLQINNTTSPIDHISGQRTITLLHCLSRVLRFFL